MPATISPSTDPTDARADALTESLGGKYLTLALAGEEYGVEILKVREIIGIMKITSVPQMPAFMKGVINLRGEVIPVIDLRLRFGLPEPQYTDETCIIVVDVGDHIGIVVDTVVEVLNIADDAVEPRPAMGALVDTSFILGMGKVGETVKILLDIDRVMTDDEIASVSKCAKSAAGS